MSRCRSCDALLSDMDLLLTQDDGSPEDLCKVCRDIVYTIDEYEEREYAFHGIEEGLKVVKIENN